MPTQYPHLHFLLRQANLINRFQGLIPSSSLGHVASCVMLHRESRLKNLPPIRTIPLPLDDISTVKNHLVDLNIKYKFWEVFLYKTCDFIRKNPDCYYWRKIQQKKSQENHRPCLDPRQRRLFRGMRRGWWRDLPTCHAWTCAAQWKMRAKFNSIANYWLQNIYS